jgi:hypothetical protein
MSKIETLTLAIDAITEAEALLEKSLINVRVIVADEVDYFLWKILDSDLDATMSRRHSRLHGRNDYVGDAFRRLRKITEEVSQAKYSLQWEIEELETPTAAVRITEAATTNNATGSDTTAAKVEVSV